MIRTRVVTVTTTATELTGTDPSDVVAGRSLIAKPTDGTVAVGGPGVTWADGWTVPAGGTCPPMVLDPGETVWAVASAGTVTVQVLEGGV